MHLVKIQVPDIIILFERYLYDIKQESGRVIENMYNYKNLLI